jgi:hypothetical protein
MTGHFKHENEGSGSIDGANLVIVYAAVTQLIISVKITEENPIQKLTNLSASQDISLLLYNQNVHYHSNSYLQYQLKK